MEAVVSSVLCRASSKAPGSLKHLKVSFICSSVEAHVSGRWLRWATSLTKLELVAVAGLVTWGVAVWNTIMRMKNLQELSIDGSFRTGKRSLLPQVLASEFQMPRLQKCDIGRNYNVPVVVLDTILAKCPALTELVVDCKNRRVKALRVASNSLKIFTLLLDYHPDGFDVTVHAPELKTLILATSKPVRIYFESAQSLQTLSLKSSHKLFYNVPENLQNLDVSLHGDPQRLPRMLMLTPMITELYLGSVYEAGKGDINIDRILAPLVNLRDIYFQRDVMSHFRPGKRKFDGLTVHFQPRHSAPDVCLLKALIEVHKIQSLMVYCKEMMDYETKAVKTGYEQWLFLFELSVFYPDRVKFVHDYLPHRMFAYKENT